MAVTVAVVGVADREAGEIPKAFVVLKPCAAADGDALMDFLRNKVAGYKRIRQVELVNAIPRSPSGKILRRLLLAPNTSPDRACENTLGSLLKKLR